MTGFTLDPRLEKDSFPVLDLPLCAVRVMNEVGVTWLLLIPRVPDLREIVDLSPGSQHQLMDEIALVSKALQTLSECDKLNVAALGNSVPQLHVHIIARFEDDPAWPGPIWGKVSEGGYEQVERDTLVSLLKTTLTSMENDG